MGWVTGNIILLKAFLDRHFKLRDWRKRCARPMETQWEFLKTLIQQRRDTEFGREHRFSEIKNIKDFQERVPIRTWDDLIPYMEEVWKGNHSVLFPPSDPIIMFAETSGTTGKPKLIPITELGYKLYSKPWDLYWAGILKVVPKTFFGKICYFPGNPEEGFIGNIPYGGISARIYLQQNKLIRNMYPYPYYISKVKDYPLRYYTIMRVAVEHSVTLIPIPNPSTVLALFRTARERRQDIIDDIRTGNLRDADKLPEDLRNYLSKRIRPNPRRAKQLEEIYRRTGDFLPKDYWPNLALINCFAYGPVRLYFPELEKFIDKEKVRIIDVGLLTSEGRFSFYAPGKAGNCLTIESNFFEFIPEKQIQNPNPEVLTLDELKKGERYFIIITNSSGLYRYNIGDLVQVADFYENLPTIAFQRKTKNYSSITGEKISEFQVTESVKKACESTGYYLENFVVCLHWDPKMPNYSLVTEPDTRSEPSVLQDFVNHVEQELLEINNEYLSKRKSLRLGPMTLRFTKKDSYNKYEEKRQRECRNISQYKHTFLVGDPDFEKQFEFIEQISSTFDPNLI